METRAKKMANYQTVKIHSFNLIWKSNPVVHLPSDGIESVTGQSY